MIHAIHISSFTFSYWYLAYAVFALGAICAALIIVLYIHRTLSLSKERKRNELRFRYQYFLYDAMVESQSESDSLDFQTIVLSQFEAEKKKRKIDVQVLTNLLLDLKRSFTGSSEAQFLQLAKALQLPQHAFQKLQHRRSYVQIEGIRELTAMHSSSESVQTSLSALSCSPHPLVSQEAHLALVKVSDKPDLSYLDTLTSPLSEWQQIHLYHHLRSIDSRGLPEFKQWLSSDNESVVIFSLRMIAKLEQYGATELVLLQLKHRSKAIVLEAINTIVQLKITQGLEPLVRLLHHSDSVIKRSSIQAIGRLGSSGHQDCINPLLSHPDYWVRRSATEAIALLQQPSRPTSLTTKPHVQSLD